MQLYLKNLFSNTERHALEKKVMHDPFEEEAFDGLSGLSAEAFEGDIKKLQSQLSERTKKRKVLFWQQPYAIAASVLFLIGLGLTMFMLNTDKERYQIVTNTQELEDAVVVTESLKEEVDKREELFQEPEKANSSLKEENEVVYEVVEEEIPVENRAKPALEKPIFSRKESSAPAKLADAVTSVVKEVEKDIEIVDKIKAEANVVESNALTSPSMTKESKEVVRVAEDSPKLETWSGVIVDNYGRPLSGVSVIVKDSNIGVVTDFDGNYLLKAPENAKIEAKYVGFETAKITFDTREEIILDEDLASLDEVVVVGYGTTKKRRVKGTLGKVQGKKTVKTSNVNVGEDLSGRVAGVAIANIESESKESINTVAIAPQGNDEGFKQWVMIQLDPSKFEKGKEYSINVNFVIDEKGRVSAVKTSTDLKSSEKKHLKTIFESSPSWIPAQNKNGTIKESKTLILWFHF